MGKAALTAIDKLVAEEGAPPEAAERIRAEFAERISLEIGRGVVLPYAAAHNQRLRLAAIKAQRNELIKVWRENQISDDVMHHLEEELDYQESRL